MTEPSPAQSRSRSSLARSAWKLPLIGALVAVLSSCRDDARQPASLVGTEAPNFKLETLDHDRFYLNEQRGKPVVLLFWDTSCQICKKEMVELESLRKKLGPRRVAMASVCADPENIDVARQMIQGLQVGFPTLLDRDARLTGTFQVSSFPTTVVITPAGKISFIREGYTEPLMRQLRTTLERHLDPTSHAD